jgi:hypothetical protein
MNQVLRLGGPAIALMVSASAANAVVNWTNPAGVALSFSWSNGYSNNGFFGDPIIAGNTFIFTPPAFNAIRGVNNTRTDTLQVDLAAIGGPITGIIIREFGYKTHSSGTTVQSTMFIKDLDDPNFPMIQDPMSFSDIDDPQTDVIEWSGIVSRNGISMNTIQLSLTNNLTTFLTGREIHKTRIEIEIVPAPASLALLGLGGLLATRRRR